MSGRGKLDYPPVDEEVIGTEQLMGRRQNPQRGDSGLRHFTIHTNNRRPGE
jgi:hypothetical protein